ncbi:MAG: nucleotidyltransferase family protein [Ruminococcus sp.]|nr:nucleotidyltransferase family protein [Ruminococcus sp.]
MSTDRYVIHLAKCALKNSTPKEKPENLSWDAIFTLADKHMIANMLWYSVNKLKNKPAPELWKKWTEIKNKAFVKDIIQKNEYRQIAGIFEKKKIRCMAVKGIFMKNMYPGSDYRTMSDIDILVDAENTGKAGDAMFELGYTCKKKEAGQHDIYFKPPVMNVEIHRRLFSDITWKNFSRYYRNAFTKAEKTDGYEYVYKMTDEEFYIYVLAHFYKHYCKSGSGIRSVMDIYIMNHSIYRNIDRKSLERKLRNLNLLDFRNQITDLSEMWFGRHKVTPELLKISDYIISSGTYGTLSNNINNRINEKGRLGYLIFSVFPPLWYMTDRYTVLNKKPYLLPIFWVWRLVESLVTRRKVILKKLKAIFCGNK